MTEIQRRVYTFFDFVGDLGGLHETLFITCQVLMYLSSFVLPNEMNIYMVSKIFSQESTKKSGGQESIKRKPVQISWYNLFLCGDKGHK